MEFHSQLWFFRIDPRIGRMWQDLSLEVGFKILGQRHIFRISQVCVGLRLSFLLAFVSEDEFASIVAEWTFNRYRAIAEITVLEDTRNRFIAVFRLDELSEEPRNLRDVV